MSFEIQTMAWDRARQFAEPIRREVFVEEQSVPESMEWDEMDSISLHAVAFDKTGQAVGYARLLPTMQLGRMAVIHEFRQQGIGSALLRALEEAAKDLQYDHLFLHAQIHALPFYEKQGYQYQGEPFDEAGIPHLMMYKSIKG